MRRVRYRLSGLTQFAADEMRHYAKAVAMRCVVAHEQFIGILGDLFDSKRSPVIKKHNRGAFIWALCRLPRRLPEAGRSRPKCGMASADAEARRGSLACLGFP